MNRILAALILSTAAIGAAHAGETGYLDNPGTQTQTSLTRAQVQNELNADRANAHAFQGELNPVAGQAKTASSQQASIASTHIAKGDGDDISTAFAFING
jgi:hypothetical protein